MIQDSGMIRLFLYVILIILQLCVFFFLLPTHDLVLAAI